MTAAREQLLDSARYLFLKNSYSNISTRQIADRAKVNSAMIAYYFGSKSGLFREVIKSYVNNVLANLKAHVPHPDKTGLQEMFVYFYQQIPAELIRLMVRTLIYERSDMRQWLLENLIGNAFGIIDLMAEKIIAHNPGNPISPRVLRVSLQSQIIFPKLAEQLYSEIDGAPLDEDFYQQLAELMANSLTMQFHLPEQTL